MQKQIRNLVIGIAGFIIFIALAQVVLVQATRAMEFDYEVFEQYLPTFQEQSNEYEAVKAEVENYIEFVLAHDEPESINQSIYEILPETDLNISYVSCNDEQLREAAYQVLELASDYFDSDTVKLLDTVYATEERVAVYLGQPRSYLYFALTEDSENMVAMTVMPTKDGFEIMTLWDFENSGDDVFVVHETNRYLFIYTNQVF